LFVFVDHDTTFKYDGRIRAGVILTSRSTPCWWRYAFRSASMWRARRPI